MYLWREEILLATFNFFRLWYISDLVDLVQMKEEIETVRTGFSGNSFLCLGLSCLSSSTACTHNKGSACAHTVWEIHISWFTTHINKDIKSRLKGSGVHQVYIAHTALCQQRIYAEWAWHARRCVRLAKGVESPVVAPLSWHVALPDIETRWCSSSASSRSCSNSNSPPNLCIISLLIPQIFAVWWSNPAPLLMLTWRCFLSCSLTTSACLSPISKLISSAVLYSRSATSSCSIYE